MQAGADAIAEWSTSSSRRTSRARSSPASTVSTEEGDGRRRALDRGQLRGEPRQRHARRDQPWIVATSSARTVSAAGWTIRTLGTDPPVEHPAVRRRRLHRPTAGFPRRARKPPIPGPERQGVRRVESDQCRAPVHRPRSAAIRLQAQSRRHARLQRSIICSCRSSGPVRPATTTSRTTSVLRRPALFGEPGAIARIRLAALQHLVADRSVQPALRRDPASPTRQGAPGQCDASGSGATGGDPELRPKRERSVDVPGASTTCRTSRRTRRAMSSSSPWDCGETSHRSMAGPGRCMDAWQVDDRRAARRLSVPAAHPEPVPSPTSTARASPSFPIAVTGGCTSGLPIFNPGR